LEGDKPYTPTRLEWLAVDLNGRLRVDLSEETGYLMQFVPMKGTDTILIYVTYLPSVGRQAMIMSIDSARKVISIEAKARGWSSWLKVDEHVEMGKSDGVGK
jgi:hypothetical protein